MKLYINNESLGREEYVGTWEEWKRGMEPTLRDWYDEYCAGLSDKFYHKEIDSVDPVPFEDWVEETLEDGLREATEDEIEQFERLI